MASPDKNELITSQLEKELAGLAMQGYNIFKKFLRARKDQLESCPKCGSFDIFTSYCNKDHKDDPRFPEHLHHTSCGVVKEVLHQVCETCSYSYLRSVLRGKV